jgi:hypothetical protein
MVILYLIENICLLLFGCYICVFDYITYFDIFSSLICVMHVFFIYFLWYMHVWCIYVLFICMCDAFTFEAEWDQLLKPSACMCDAYIYVNCLWWICEMSYIILFMIYACMMYMYKLILWNIYVCCIYMNFNRLYDMKKICIMLAIWASSRETIILKKITFNNGSNQKSLQNIIYLKKSTFDNGSNVLTVVKIHI